MLAQPTARPSADSRSPVSAYFAAAVGRIAADGIPGPPPWVNRDLPRAPPRQRSGHAAVRAGPSGLACQEQIELLARIVVKRGPKRLVVTAVLSEVSCLELQGDLHERIGNIGGCLVGDGVFGQAQCL